MTRPIRVWLSVAVLISIAGIRNATAQTVIVKNAAAGSTVEVMVNDTAAGSATVDPSGYATVSAPLVTGIANAQTDARVLVDVCGTTTRVLLVETVHQPPAAGGVCNRQTIPDVFIVGANTTFVVDVGGSSASVLVRQGPAPAAWLEGAAGVRQGRHRTATPAPLGLTLSAGIGLGTFANLSTAACGDVAQCDTPSAVVVPAVSASYWVKKFLAVDVSYLAPADALTTGSGTNFRFRSTVTTDVFMLLAKAGGQAGPARIYALGGIDRQTSISTTTENVDATPTSPAAATTSGFKSAGWSWVAGGGVETWLNRWIGVYVEGAHVVLKGKAVDRGEGTFDDSLNAVHVGARVHIGR